MKSKTAAKKKSGSTDKKTSKSGKSDKSQKDVLLKELKGLVKNINDEGIAFLIKQAKILLHNMEVDKRAAERRDSAGKAIKPDAKVRAAANKLTLEVKESENSKSYIFVINKARKFFTLEEMRKLVNICHLSGSEKAGMSSLYNWFFNNRKDVLIEIGIGSAGDLALSTIYNYLIKNYTVKKN